MKSVLKAAAALMLGLMITFLPISIGQATSLWSDSASTAGLFIDHKARAVGDVLTIIINENSTASRTGSASNSKSSEVGADAGVGIFKFLAEASASSSDSFKAQGSINNSNRVNGKITVEVTEVKPNGNLVVSGTQSIKQNGEEHRITISGTVRPDDITSDNTVLSNYVADAQIKMDGKGPISRKQRQGILSQIFNFLF
ncbi:flagellar basal body L-ring protein FlgH [Dendrosporobacter sp. 1207_IL3150]|uniref:flagellar basal body L-ring protein FlgH n=1 Tax=Dendrosporobacter sp. 1207_IL3150 TaxID=3084054 RepID=UPI002FD9715B